MEMKDIKKEIQDWIDVEERAGRVVDENRLNQYLQLLMRRRNNMPREDFNGLSPQQMHDIMYHPFCNQCVVELNTLTKEQYEKIPLVRQSLFLLNTLSIKELLLSDKT